MASASANSIGSPRFSEYYSTLLGPAKARYKEKVNLCRFDPYLLKISECSNEFADFPAVEYPDIVNYLVLQTSWVTGQQMKAYKAMDAYNFFISGWVNSVMIKKVTGNDKVVVTARVNHSQRARETPLKTWLLVEKNGTVCCAHCNCMAGLSEACSHIGAVLFALEAGVRMRQSVTCTQEKGKWLMPAYVREIPYLPVAEMDMSSARKRHSILGAEQGQTPEIQHTNRATIEAPSNDEKSAFYANISKCGSKPAILSLLSPYNESYIPKPNSNLPMPLLQFYNQEHLGLTFQELLSECAKLLDSLQVAAEEAAAIEASTRKQSSSKEWFQQRAGRITASKFKSACATNPDKPSKSLIKGICYPDAHRFSNAATKWGIEKEPVAREAFEFAVAADHLNLSVAECGLHVNGKLPFLGASPDGLVFCECCGNGICEIKCPHKFKDSLISTAILDTTFCLEYDEASAKIHLKKNHAYFYQVQCQLLVTELVYCDFVVWTNKDLFVERILPDSEFIKSCTTRAKDFYLRAVLPELLGKWFTRSSAVQSVELPLSDSEEEGIWCSCQQHIEDSQLIRCDNANCPIQWFHLPCVGLTVVPEDKWFCSSCTK